MHEKRAAQVAAPATSCVVRSYQYGLIPQVVPHYDTRMGRLVLYVIRWVSVLHARWLIEKCLAYTMFNVYLPKLLETGTSEANSTKSLEDSLWDLLIFTLGGCPGAIVCCLVPLLYTFD